MSDNAGPSEPVPAKKSKTARRRASMQQHKMRCEAAMTAAEQWRSTTGLTKENLDKEYELHKKESGPVR